eukprot:TCONS_00008959-protein
MSGFITMENEDTSSDSGSDSETGLKLALDKQRSNTQERLDNYVAATPAEFVSKFGGTHVIEKVLVANNGIAAVKCIRSMRQWAYDMFGNDKAVKFVAMVTPEDLKANAEYVKMADHFVTVPGGTNNNNYANVELILDIARRTAVQAVWAGWGHASENPKLPELLSKNGIAFIGPTSHSMWALGDKVASSIIAQSIDIPTLPWSGNGITLDIDKDSKPGEGNYVSVPMEKFQEACVTDVMKGLVIAHEIGYPVMIKASEGGGGKGIRKCNNDEEFSNGFRQVETEVPGSPIFIMKCMQRARHLEVQLLADQYGEAISLFGRDCSVQRRHQKIIEEGPVTVCKGETLVKMEKNAVNLAKLVGYVSAGTVEYLYDCISKEVYFLELNPRLQVEHPCTEMITNINLAACQLQIAMGIPLHRIKDIRLLYGESPWSAAPISFTDYYGKLKPKGHVIACRITAENPDEGFKPSSGTIKELSYRSNAHCWGYFSVTADGSLHEYADSQFGHLFAGGENREAARKNMVVALKELSIRGDFRTTVEYLVRLLEDESFKRNTIDTAWLDSLIAEKVKAESPEIIPAVICGALHIADDVVSKTFLVYQSALERGQIPKASNLKITENVELIHNETKYILLVTKCGATQYFLEMNESCLEVDVHRMSDGGMMVSIGDTTYTSFLKDEVSGYRVIINGKTCVFRKENDPTILRSPSPGKLINYTIEDGGHVFAGEAYAEIEVMKMIMPLVAACSGCLHHIKVPGTSLEPGMVIGRLTLDDPNKVAQTVLHRSAFPNIGNRTKGIKLHQIFQASHENLINTMNGYCVQEPYFLPKMDEDLKTILKVLNDPALPLIEMQELLTSVTGRIPQEVGDKINNLLKRYSSNLTSILNRFPSQKINMIIDSYASTLTKRNERDLFFLNSQGIVQLVQKFREGIKGYRKNVLIGLLKQYVRVEKLFNEGNFEKCVSLMVDRNDEKSMEKIIEKVFSHDRVLQKNALVIKIIDCLCSKEHQLTEEIRNIMLELTELNQTAHAKVALKARQVLISSQKPSYELRHNQYESIFLSAIDLYGQQVNPENLQKIILAETAVYDILPSFFYHRNNLVRKAALEVYIRRSYIAYELTQLFHDEIIDGLNMIEFTFKLPTTHPNKPCTPVEDPSQTSFSRPPLTPTFSISESWKAISSVDPGYERMGAMVALKDFEKFKEAFDDILKQFDPNEILSTEVGSNGLTSNKRSSSASLKEFDNDPIHIINVCIKKSDISTSNQEEEKNNLQEFIRSKREQLCEHGIRRISILMSDNKGEFPHIYTFRARDQFYEDHIYRHLEPALAFQLEVNRMSSFDLTPINCTNKSLHLYYASAKKQRDNQEVTDYRFFVRSIVRHGDFVTKEASFGYLVKASEVQMLEALDEIEVALSKVDRRTDCNHIFLNFYATIIIEPQKIEESIRMIVLRHALRLWKLRVLKAECKIKVRLTPESPIITLRLFMSNESGYSLDMYTYQEVFDKASGRTIFKSYGDRQGPHHGLPITTPYVTKDHLQFKRFAAQSQLTTYVYDYPELFRQAVHKQWKDWVALNGLQWSLFQVRKDLIECKELCLDSKKELVEVNRHPGENDCGIVAWHVTLYTPEYDEGREVYICANDITHMIGSFSLEEDSLYDKILQRAIKAAVPFIYISANSGARIGLAEDVKNAFRVAWIDKDRPDKGFKYLYVTPSDYTKLASSNSIHAEAIDEDGEVRYKITDVIGKETGIGVENLKGSGLIAGRTSEAYEKTVTLNLVTCRTVGIGSYLTRLGQRIVQVENSNIILTGFHALNKLLGRPVYSSNAQLGGPQIMHKNGVSHLVVKDEFNGLAEIVKWLSYIPKKRGEPLPVSTVTDPVDRTVDFNPPKGHYNPRHMIAGREEASCSNRWESGLFDKGSFTEVLSNWAQTVICGRARLGGIPVGVIVPEVRPVEKSVPPDPADPTSETKLIVQAGQVWYPDSSFKTAQCISDFNQEGLPLIILANWRGFSGGMKDMYDQILKFGAYIVDGLRKYKQPVLIYIPPKGELRGGAWVVVDPSINEEHMEMYADKEARGGVLEPSGTCEIKYKMKDIVRTMKRLDEKYSDISNQIAAPDTPAQEKKKLEKSLKEREKDILPVYQKIALTYADLHDTAGRMQEKGCIDGVLEWKNSRKFLYWRLKRLLLQDKVKQMLPSSNGGYTKAHVETVIQRLFLEENGTVQSYLWEDNEFVCRWMEDDLRKDEGSSLIKEHTKWLQRDIILRDIKNIVSANPEVAMDAIVNIAQQMNESKRNELSRVLLALNSTNERASSSSGEEGSEPSRTNSVASSTT